MSCQAWTWVVPDLLPDSPPWIATPQGVTVVTQPDRITWRSPWLCHVYAMCSESIESIPSCYSHSSVNPDVFPCIFPFPHSFCIKIASEIAMCLHALSHDIPWLTSSTPKSFSSSWRHFQTCTISLVWQVPVSFPAFSLLSVSMQCSLFSPFDFVRLFLVYTIHFRFMFSVFPHHVQVSFQQKFYVISYLFMSASSSTICPNPVFPFVYPTHVLYKMCLICFARCFPFLLDFPTAATKSQPWPAWMKQIKKGRSHRS